MSKAVVTMSSIREPRLDLNLINAALTDSAEKLCRDLRLPDGYQAAMGMILANLHDADGEPVGYSRSAAQYPQDRYGPFAPLECIVAISRLVSSGLAFGTRGSPDRRATVQATPSLHRSLAQRAQQASVFREVIILRGPKQYDPHREQKLADDIGYTDNDETNGMRRATHAYNEFMARHKVVDSLGTIHSTRFARVFNNGSFTSGGRFYRASYQGLSGAQRRALKIDGKPLVELDFSALHPTLLYLAAGLVPPENVYEIPGIERRAAKLAFNIALNADSFERATFALTLQLDGDQKLANECMASLPQAFPQLSNSFFSGVGLELQRTDSDIAAAVMQQFTEFGRPILVMNDSFLVQLADQALLHETMTKNFQQITRSTHVPRIR